MPCSRPPTPNNQSPDQEKVSVVAGSLQKILGRKIKKERNMQFNSYLLFDGNCEEAFKTYEKIFGEKSGASLRTKAPPPPARCRPNGKRKFSTLALPSGPRFSWPPTRLQAAIRSLRDLAS